MTYPSTPMRSAGYWVLGYLEMSMSGKSGLDRDQVAKLHQKLAEAEAIEFRERPKHGEEAA